MIEYLDVLDERGEKTGESLPNKEVHAKGLFHRGVHVWIMNSSKEFLLQKRTMNKWAYPGYWTMSAGGHISSSDTCVEAAQREVQEEIGLDIPTSEFELVCSIKQPRTVHRKDYIDEEFDDIYLVRRDLNISDLKFAPDEVDDARWISIEELENWIKGNGESLTPHIEEEFNKLLPHIK